MARKRKKKEAGGVPEWIVTYGDMMTLLLCFFILLAAFSELKKDRRDYQDVVRAIKEQFGYTGGEGRAPTEDSPATSILNKLEGIALHKEEFRQISAADDPGVTGKETTVQRVREGLQFTVGGLVTFDAGSAELKNEAKEQLARVAERVRGLNNKLEIRGHATNRDGAADSAFDDLWNLSYARAQAVREFLTRSEQGIEPERIRVVACGNNEPLRSRAYDEPSAGVNRRVELILIESLVRDFQDPSGPTGVQTVIQ